MDVLDLTFYVTNMPSYTNDIPNLINFPTFNGINSISVEDHWNDANRL